MSLFNIFKRNSKTPDKTLTINGIGKMTLVKEHGEILFKGNISSASIGENFILNFPVSTDPTNFQIQYYKSIEQNWNHIKNQLPQGLVKDLIVNDILIPDESNSMYDIGAEIVMKSSSSVYSVILNGTTVEEVIHIE